MPQLTPNVFKQAPEEALTRLPRFDDGLAQVSFRHILYVYRDKAIPVNTAVQSITFETIATARRFAQPDYTTNLVAVTLPEDADLVPADALTTPPLERVVGDVAQFEIARSLPLLFDILTNGAAVPLPDTSRPEEVEFIVMTNSDIHVQPVFYRALAELIRWGYDVITVNRRTIDVDPENRTYSPIFLIDAGLDHPGFDCFVFPAAMFRKFVRSDCCCGTGEVMRSLLYNLVAHARRMLMLTRAHMTYHLGDDVYWRDPKLGDYLKFNTEQALSVVAALSQDRDKAARLKDFINAHEGKKYREALQSLLP